jgi:hypothetical protein
MSHGWYFGKIISTTSLQQQQPTLLHCPTSKPKSNLKMSSNKEKKRPAQNTPTSNQQKKPPGKPIGRMDMINPSQSKKNKQSREKCQQIYATTEVTTQEATTPLIDLPWLPYCGDYFTKVKIQVHAKEFFHKLRDPCQEWLLHRHNNPYML